MPTWKINDYYYYFKVGDVEKGKPVHIHVETSRGEISFWISKSEIKLKTIERNVNDHERNKVERVVKERINFFLEEWEKILIKK